MIENDNPELLQERPQLTAAQLAGKVQQAQVTPHSTPQELNHGGVAADPGEFFRMARAHQYSLYRRALRLTRNPTDAWDLVQTTFERALAHKTEQALVECPLAWLSTILRHTFCDERRRTKPIWVELDPETFGESPPSLRDRENEPAWVSVTDEQLKTALATLPLAFRRVFQLYEIEHYSYQDIADLLGLPINTVGTRLSRARHKLRRLLQNMPS